MYDRPVREVLLSVVVCLLLPSLLLAETAAARKAREADALKAEALFGEAITLHKEAKYEQALAKVKEAVALAPGNRRLDSYRGDLEALVGKDDLERHALAAPPEAEASIEALGRYLAKGAKDDRAKARAVYRWVTDRIAYDAASFFAGAPGDNSAAAVLKSRLAVCEGYSNLYEALGGQAGLDVVKVTGYAKGVSYTPGEQIRSNHAWNAVKLDGKWRLIDATWGAGNLRGKQFQKSYRAYFFLVPPEELIFTHFPEDPSWQLLAPAVRPDEFSAWPRVSDLSFPAGLSAAEVRSKAGSGRGLVEMFNVAGPRLKLVEAPVERSLRAGTKYEFRVEAPGYLEVGAVVDGKLQRFVRKGDLFEGEVVPTKGDLKIAVKASATARTFDIFCQYRVE